MHVYCLSFLPYTPRLSYLTIPLEDIPMVEERLGSSQLFRAWEMPTVNRHNRERTVNHLYITGFIISPAGLKPTQQRCVVRHTSLSTELSRRLFLIYSRLSLSRSRRDSLEYFEISVLRHIRFAELTNTIIRTIFNKWICNLTPDVKRYMKYCGKEEKLLLWKRGEFLLFSIIFWYLLLDFHVRTGTRFSLREKRYFEISEVEITRVDYMWLYPGNATILVTIKKHGLSDTPKVEMRSI